MKAFSLLLLLFLTTLVNAQKVANYSFGKPGTKDFEQFAFWVKDGNRSEIVYTYGKDWKELKLKYAGIVTSGGRTSFKVEFPNKYILLISAQGDRLKVVDAAGKYSKTFAWKYEGPVNGIGTFCQPCAEDKEEAISLVKKSFLNKS